MSISQNGYTLAYDHDPITAVAPISLQIRPVEVFGLRGVGHLIGSTGEQPLSCRMMLDGFDTATTLQNKFDEIQSKAGTLIGDITETLDGGQVIHKQCTFLGAVPLEHKRLDGGVNGWYMPIRLMWVSRNPLGS